LRFILDIPRSRIHRKGGVPRRRPKVGLEEPDRRLPRGSFVGQRGATIRPPTDVRPRPAQLSTCDSARQRPLWGREDRLSPPLGDRNRLRPLAWPTHLRASASSAIIRLGPGTSERVAGRSRRRTVALEWSDPPYSGGHWVADMIEPPAAPTSSANPAGPLAGSNGPRWPSRRPRSLSSCLAGTG
jgi:hypothetical protein